MSESVNGPRSELTDESTNEPSPTDQRAVRAAKLEGLRAAGVDPYPVRFDRDHTVGEVRTAFADIEPGTETGTRVKVVESGFASLECSGHEQRQHAFRNGEGWDLELRHLADLATREVILRATNGR